MTDTAFQTHPVRGPFNALFFGLTGGLFDLLLGPHKRRLLVDLPDTVVELGSGAGANLRYLAPGSRLIAVEPNPAMHGRLRRAARRRGVRLDLREVPAERTDLPDASADVVVSSLVLCSVTDVDRVLAEVRRVLRPGGRFMFVEHVAAPDGTALRRLQGWVRRPWAWLFEGCSCERDLGTALRSAGFGSVDLEAYRLRSPVLPFNPQIAGVATA